MKHNWLLLVFMGIFSASLVAQEAKKDTLSDSSKIDNIYTLQKKMYTETRNEPLKDKNFGIELNLFRILLIDKDISLTGSFSLFNVNRQAEIVFPVHYGRPEDQRDLNVLTVDCHFRYFLGNTQNGFYVSAFTRLAFLNGYLGEDDYWFGDNDIPTTKSSEQKIGFGVGLGYRIFSYKGLYWGTSLSFGRYVIGENDKFRNDSLNLDDDGEFIYDFEFLKFGFAF